MSFPAMPPLGPPNLANGDSGPGGQNDYAPWVQMRPYLRNLLVAAYDARFYGATGDGVTDDTLAIQLALDLCRLNGGGVVYLPAGVYKLSARAHPVSGGQACLWIGSNTLLRGDGPGATVLQLAASQPNQTWIVTNYQVNAPYSDSNISIEALSVHGNAGAQAGTVDAQYGIKIHGVLGLTHANVSVRDVYGTTSGGNGPNGTPGEGFHFDSNACTHVSYHRCRARSDGVLNTATGFSANRGNDVSYTDCWVSSMKTGQGFTHWTCWSLRYTNCWAAQCGNDAFHSEFTDGIFYVNCQAGGTTNPNLTNPYAASTNIGALTGFHLFNATNFHIINCIGQHNTNYGIMIEAATGPGEIVGGSWNSNNYGIRLQDAASVTQTTIKARPDCTGNTTSSIWYNGAVLNLFNFPTAPAVPATTVPLTNPFPIDMIVYVLGGTVTGIAVDANTVLTATPGTVIVRQGGTITLTYTVAPTWKWQAVG